MLQNLTGWHALVVVAIVLLLFGAAKLPALARSVGQSMRILKTEASAPPADDHADDDQRRQQRRRPGLQVLHAGAEAGDDRAVRRDVLDQVVVAVASHQPGPGQGLVVGPGTAARLGGKFERPLPPGEHLALALGEREFRRIAART